MRTDATRAAATCCTGNCRQGRDCPARGADGPSTDLLDAAFDHDVAPDPDRCIAPPARTAADHAYRARALRWVLAVDAVAIAALAALLRFGWSG
jgi:hypothetical protein